MELKNAWVFDIEVYPNLFVLVARPLAGNLHSHERFLIHDDSEESDYLELMEWLDTRPRLIGFNNLEYDGQIIEFMKKRYENNKKTTAADIYKFQEEELFGKENRFDLPYSQWDLSFKHIDLYKINHFDNSSKRTSLKWLEFTMRFPKMQDLPFPPGTHISKSNTSKVSSYCRNDVDVTYDFYYKCVPMIELRQELANKYRNRSIMNMSDSSIGEYIFKEALKKAGINIKKKGTTRHHISVYECLVPYIEFESDIFKQVHENYKDMTLENVETEGLKGIHKQSVMFEDMEFTFGIGGLHACYKPGVYDSDDEHVIVSVDVASYYPWVAIANGFYPAHLGPEFCKIYEDLYWERKKYPKGSALNYALKIALNGVYGKSNNKHSDLRDPAYTVKITVNGQLLLTMLAEQLAKIGRLLMCNTDGIEVRIKRTDLDDLHEICEAWENLTGLELEHDFYKRLVIRDVNNYIAVTEKGKAKRKGFFRTYYDYTEEDGKPHSYNENPSATIIPEAIYEYFVNDVPIEETIENENSLYPFMEGIKGRKGFEYWFITANNDGVIDLEKRHEKAIRFYMKPGGANIYKFWLDNRVNNIQAVRKGKLVGVAMNVTKKGALEVITTDKETDESKIKTNYYVNKDYYIQECYSAIEDIVSYKD